MIDAHHGWNASFKPQFLGFVLSVLLVAASYRIVTHYHLAHWALTFTIFGIAIAQALIQLVFFLHLGLESKPYWNTITFIFVVLVIVIVIGGSLWIMDNLSYNLMPDMKH
jgi:cytochrome o ubiquinol oxidase subunit IV